MVNCTDAFWAGVIVQATREKKTYANKGAVAVDQPLDDPVAEKLRQQRCAKVLGPFQTNMDI